LQETAPNSHGDASWEEKSSLFPTALRERGSGGEVLLSEKRPLPQNLLPHTFRLSFFCAIMKKKLLVRDDE